MENTGVMRNRRAYSPSKLSLLPVWIVGLKKVAPLTPWSLIKWGPRLRPVRSRCLP